MSTLPPHTIHAHPLMNESSGGDEGSSKSEGEDEGKGSDEEEGEGCDEKEGKAKSDMNGDGKGGDGKVGDNSNSNTSPVDPILTVTAGQGLFASRSFKQGEIVTISPVLLLPKGRRHSTTPSYRITVIIHDVLLCVMMCHYMLILST